jgi:hypothetical protein
MKYLLFPVMIIILSASSCRLENSDLTLDDLDDKQEITGEVTVDCSKYKNQKVEKILLNGEEYGSGQVLDLTESGFYRFEVFWTNGGYSNAEVIRIVILDKERGEAEWGLKKWIPKELSTDIMDDSEVSLIYPPDAPPGVNMPLIVLINDKFGHSASDFTASLGSQNFRIKSGIGSVQIPPGEHNNPDLIIGHRNFILETRATEKVPVLLQNVLSEDTFIPEGSFVKIESDLTLQEGLTLTIDTGSFVIIDPAVNIYVNGTLLIRGSQENPVVFTCSDPAGTWGGIIGKSSGHRIRASHAIFCQSGYHTGDGYDYGHAHRQALFYSENGILSFSHCYMIDHAGQVFYPVSSTLDIQHSLVQRAKTGGQINSSRLTVWHCIFTDFPDDSQFYRDEDNDCLYLSGSDATISQSLFMYAKDDGLDSGGDGGGDIQVTGTRFEAIFHEGAALSSGGTTTKSHTFKDCTFTNCGQGLELGYSSPNHMVTVDSCLFFENGIGIRYGDNYISQHQGIISVSNSESIFNYDRDIWNMVRDTWSADTFKMQFNNVMVSKEDPQYPNLLIHE